jgi:hypothetical protein
MANFLKAGGNAAWADREVAVEVALQVAKAALLVCVLWYAGQVLVRQMAVPVRPAPDAHWGLAEHRVDRPLSVQPV